MRKKIFVALTIPLFCLSFILFTEAQDDESTNYASIAGIVDAGRQASVIQYLAGLKSRITGLEGADAAASYIQAKFAELGLRDIRTLEFPVVVPVEKRAALTAAGGKYELHALWPNLTNPSTPDSITGHIIYAGTSKLYEYNQKYVTGSIVLLDFNCGGDWFNAFLLGAKAVIFIEPSETLRGETEKKYLSIPLCVPRYWISRSQGEALARAVSGKKEIIGELRSAMAWEKRTGKNIVGFIPGKDPKLKNDLVIVESFYDAISVVPALAPGAEDACGISALLEVARTLKAFPPKRTTMILASSGHFQGLAGMKHFMSYWNEQAGKGKEGKKTTEDNLAFKKPAKCSSREPSISYVPDSAFDGKMNTRWSSSQRRRDDEWLTVDLQKPETIAQIVLQWELSYCPRYVLMSSVDGTSWDTIIEAKSNKGGEDVVAFTPRTARYLKMQQLSRVTGSSGCSLWEFEVYPKQVTAVTAVQFPEIALSISLDLSSRGEGVGIFYKGSFYDQREDDLKPKYSSMGMMCSTYASAISEELGLPEQYFANGINPLKGRSWRTFIPTDMAFNGEAVTLFGRTGITLASTNDGRPLVDTPLNKFDKINVSNLGRQTKFAACLVNKMVNGPKMLTKLDIPNYACTLKGRVVEFDPRVSYIPNTPVPGAIVAGRGRAKIFTGVRGELIDIASFEGGENGTDTASFKFIGLPSVRTSFIPPENKQQVEAYIIDTGGQVIYAPDMGEQGAKAYPISVPLDWAEKEATVVVFPCVSVSMYDLIDQRFYKTFQSVSVFDGKTNAEPTLYGFSFPRQMGTFFQEPAALIYMRPNELLKVTMGAGIVGTQFTLLNSTETEPLGRGYKAMFHSSVPLTPYKVAKDMWILDNWRMGILKRRGIENNRLEELHRLALRDLTRADTALAAMDYEHFIRYSRTAWGFESRAYPDVRATGDDVVKGVIFYLFLLLPFAYFLERLFFAFPDIRKQIVGTFALFLIVFAALRYVHPAFDITLTPFMVLLAFITLALAILVIGIIMGKFDELFKEYKKKVTGVHTTDVGRISATATAFSLGVSNMRKRKGRTGLTCATLILLTFTVLSFTSVKTFMRSSKMSLEKPAMYEGLLFRERNWEPMEETTYKILYNEFKNETNLSPRAWYYSTMVGNQSFIDLKNGQNKYTITAINGLSPNEYRLSPVYERALTAGRWFEENDLFSCILPASVAKSLDVGIGSEVMIFGLPFRLIGILDEDELKNIIDLDEEEITPVNYLAMSERMTQQSTAESPEAPPQKFIHLMPHEIAFLPYATLMNLGGQLRSVALGAKDSAQVKEILADVMPRLALNLFVGEEGKTYYSSSIGRTSFSGLPNLFIPILIAAFIVLNTMLGSVFERVREIGIYSAVGLAPSHIAALFLAEACVYATVGSVSGYLLGQGVAKIITALHLFQGLTLNYSSVSATGSIGVVILMVILSSIYPARKASTLAVPSVERRWKLPEPVGDSWHFEMPFTVTGEEARGINAFLKEFFDGHVEYSIGDFYTEPGKLFELSSQFGTAYKLAQMAWLAPFDLGVSQEVSVDTEPIKTPGVYNLSLNITRKSGDIVSWKRTNTRFVNHLRKQLLLWRTLLPEERTRYAKKADELITKA